MVFDKECMFLDGVNAASLPTVSDVVVNGAGGGAGESVFLFVGVAGGNAGGSGSVSLETSATESFASATEVAKGSFATGKALAMRLPVGLKRYLRIKASGSFTQGKVTAGLVYDVVITSDVFK